MKFQKSTKIFWINTVFMKNIVCDIMIFIGEIHDKNVKFMIRMKKRSDKYDLRDFLISLKAQSCIYISRLLLM